MKEETKKLITADMLSEVLGLEVKDMSICGDTIRYSNTYLYSKSPSVGIYELKYKLEEYFAGKAKIIFTSGYDVDRKVWAAVLDIKLKRAQTKLEALLKLYHAVKEDK